MFLPIMVEIFTSPAIFMVIIGVVIGIIIGAIPGLGPAIGITVLLPFTFSMDQLSALLLLAGVFMGSGVGGSVPAILLNIPGTPAAICTTIEGYPLMRKGRGKEALYLASIASTFGGMVGVGVLIFFAPILGRFALRFGPPEMTLVAAIGLLIIGSLASDSLLKGIFGACFGILVSTVGIDTLSGTPRFTFGITNFIMGFSQVSLALGIIAGREVVVQTQKSLNDSWARRNGMVESTGSDGAVLENVSVWTVLAGIFRRPVNLIKSSVIGTLIGILPGAGAAIASYVAYGEAKRVSKDPFGDGSPDGIVAAESSNNSAVGGTFVPMMALGIPGSPSAALIFTALTIHGILPGPRLFSEHAETAYGFMYGLLISVLVMGLVSIVFVPMFVRIVRVHMKYIMPVVAACVVLGAFSVRGNLFDVYVAIAFTVIGVLFLKVSIPPAPVFLGYILGPLIEGNLRRSMTISGAAGQGFVAYAASRPLSLAIVAVGIILLYANVKSIQLGKEIDGGKQRTPKGK